MAAPKSQNFVLRARLAWMADVQCGVTANNVVLFLWSTILTNYWTTTTSTVFQQSARFTFLGLTNMVFRFSSFCFT